MSTLDKQNLKKQDNFIITMYAAFFLLSVSTLSGFVGKNIVSSDLQELINENAFVRHFIFFLILFFTLSISLKSRTATLYNSFINSLVVYTIFIIFHRSTLIEQLIALIFTLIGYILYRDIEYNKLNKKPTNKYKQIAMYSTFGVGMISMFVGFIRNITTNKGKRSIIEFMTANN